MNKKRSVVKPLVLCALIGAGCVSEYGDFDSGGSSEKTKSVKRPSPALSRQKLPQGNAESCMESYAPPLILDHGTDEQQEYATDLRLTAGCVVDPLEMAVASGHENEEPCESVLATPMMNMDGDFFEVAAEFQWTVQGDGAIQLHCLNGPSDNHCWPIASKNVFDNENGAEPAALVTACAVNHCPEPQPDDCAQTICASVTVKVAVNVEGPWIFMGATLDPKTPATLSQVGREFEDKTVGIRGSVLGMSVRFEYGDYAYEGVVEKGEETMVGTVTDLITSGYAGEWWAIRKL